MNAASVILALAFSAAFLRGQSTTVLVETGGAIAAAGVPAGATWKTFGVPSINDAGDVAHLAAWTSPSGAGGGIFSEGNLVAKTGDAVPDAAGVAMAGVTFQAFGEPLWNHDGAAAFSATLKGAGVVAANARAVFIKESAGSLRMLFRTGDVLAGAGGGTLRAVTNLGLSETGTVMFFTGTLTPGTGGATAATDAVMCSVMPGSAPVLRLREGGEAAGLPGETIAMFSVLNARPFSPGHGRGVAGDTAASVAVLFRTASGMKGVASLDDSGGSRIYRQTDVPPGYGAGAVYTNFGPPVQDAGGGLFFRGTVAGGASTGADNAAIFGEDGMLDALVKKGDVATGMPAGAVFDILRDPVGGVGRNVAFIGIATGGGVTAPDNDGVWFLDGAVLPVLVAREGFQAPDVPAGAVFRAFTSLALAEGAAGPVFAGTLVTGAGGVTAANNSGIWGCDSGGTLRLLLREGDVLAGKTIRSFTALSRVSGSQAQARSLNSARQLIVRTAFTDGTQALVRVDW